MLQDPRPSMEKYYGRTLPTSSTWKGDNLVMSSRSCQRGKQQSNLSRMVNLFQLTYLRCALSVRALYSIFCVVTLLAIPSLNFLSRWPMISVCITFIIKFVQRDNWRKHYPRSPTQVQRWKYVHIEILVDLPQPVCYCSSIQHVKCPIY